MEPGADHLPFLQAMQLEAPRETEYWPPTQLVQAWAPPEYLPGLHISHFSALKPTLPCPLRQGMHDMCLGSMGDPTHSVLVYFHWYFMWVGVLMPEQQV